MQVSAWKNGNQNDDTGAGYGIRIRRQDVDRVINWKKIHIANDILIRDGEVFDENCPEIRSYLIGLFLIDNNLNTWPRGNPHQLTLTRLGRNTFRLHL